MVEKLSSASTMSAASLATSVPVMPMAMPMSASFRAGASLTPSPVMAATWPISLSSRTMSCLCRGSAREKHRPPVPCSHSACYRVSARNAILDLKVKICSLRRGRSTARLSSAQFCTAPAPET